jgi:multiple sugar transport system substrate-binding protein
MTSMRSDAAALSRRALLGRLAALGLAAGVGPVLNACGRTAASPTAAGGQAAASNSGLPTPAPATTPEVSSGAKAANAPAKPIQFVGWQYHPEIVEENVKTFTQLYNENVQYSLIPGDYHSIAETKLIGGQSYDMLYSEEDHLVRWNTAGWVGDIEDLPGAKAMKDLMYPNNVKDLSLPNGRLGGLPYYSGHNAFIYNEQHTSKLQNWKPPTTWEELTDQCKELKAKGIAEYPYLSAWNRAWASLSWSIFAIWYSEGEDVFDKDFNPTFKDGGVAFKKVLEWHKMLYDQKLVAPDILTMEEEALPAYQTGRYTFMVLHDYDQKTMNDPKQSKAAGAVKNALIPGKTQDTFIWTAMYLIGAKPVDRDRAWNLMQFFGGKAKDGQYHVAKRWALDFGLGTGWKEVVEDPEVVASWKQWRDLDITKQQIQHSHTRDISKASWFPEWDWYMMGKVQDYIAGKQDISGLIKDLYDKAVTLKKNAKQ